MDSLRQKTVKQSFQILQNSGFKEDALKDYALRRSRVSEMMANFSLAFVGQDKISFPSYVSREEELLNPELADRAFRRRVAFHTLSVGYTMKLLLEMLCDKGAISITRNQAEIAHQIVALHGLSKIMEINLRNMLDIDAACLAARDCLLNILRTTNFPKEYITLAFNNGHIGARDFICASPMWDLVRISSYICDEIVEETTIQLDILSKVNRLTFDKRYNDLNLSGFSDMNGFEEFSNDGVLVPKFEIQKLATTSMSKILCLALEIEPKDLGKNLVAYATKLGIYQATIRLN